MGRRTTDAVIALPDFAGARTGCVLETRRYTVKLAPAETRGGWGALISLA